FLLDTHTHTHTHTHLTHDLHVYLTCSQLSSLEACQPSSHDKMPWQPAEGFFSFSEHRTSRVNPFTFTLTYPNIQSYFPLNCSRHRLSKQSPIILYTPPSNHQSVHLPNCVCVFCV